jgi:hypothetical protein
MSDDVGGLDRVAANERRFLALLKAQSVGSVIVLACECTRAECDERIEITLSQYQPIRSSAARYAICPHQSHVDRKADRLVERQPSHWVVERETTLEVLSFFRPATRAIVSELTALARERNTPDAPALTDASSDEERPGPA